LAENRPKTAQQKMTIVVGPKIDHEGKFLGGQKGQPTTNGDFSCIHLMTSSFSVTG